MTARRAARRAAEADAERVWRDAIARGETTRMTHLYGSPLPFPMTVLQVLLWLEVVAAGVVGAGAVGVAVAQNYLPPSLWRVLLVATLAVAGGVVSSRGYVRAVRDGVGS